MKRFLKFVIAGAVIFGIGIAIMVITLGVNGWNIDDDYEMMSYECSEQNSVLDLEFSAGTLDIDYYDGDTIKVEYPQNKNLTANITEKDGTLTYETISPRKWWNWNWLRNIPTAKILIPKGDVIDVQLDIDAGTVKIADGAYGNFEVEMNAGTLDIGNIVCDKLSVEMNAGTIGVKSASSSKDVLMDVSAGTIKIGSLTCPSFVGDVNAGTANIERLQASSTVVDISAGTMKLCMVGAKSEYNVVVDKSAGSCNISSQKGSKDLQILAEISAGTLVVKFTS